jgi:hypothetical protein
MRVGCSIVLMQIVLSLVHLREAMTETSSQILI